MTKRMKSLNSHGSAASFAASPTRGVSQEPSLTPGAASRELHMLPEETRDLVRAFNAIRDPAMRQRAMKYLRDLGEPPSHS